MITVFIPTHNPDRNRLLSTLEGLKNQSLAYDQWELLIIDNASTNKVLDQIDLSWHPLARVISEYKLGLTWARLRGFTEARGSIAVLVDDDNILENHYLAYTVELFNTYPKIGAIGGKSLPRFDVKPSAWVANFWGSLALRDLGNEAIISDLTIEEKITYPDYAPIGAGMAIRKEALQSYVFKILSMQEGAIISDRKGTSLSSGGDNDIILTILFDQWEVAYFPQLQLEHIIPEGRTTKAYLAKMNHNASKSWIALLNAHGICPWSKIEKWTVPIRKIKAYFACRAWRSETSYIRWKGACGMFEGQADL